MRTKRAFTLVEILVVIAILGVLAAVIFPVTARVREKGRQATCQQNLRQLYSATLQYVQDYDGHFPNAYDYEAVLTPYLKNAALFQCPSQSHPHHDSTLIGPQDYGFNSAQLNIHLTMQVNGRVVGEPKIVGLN